MEKKEKFVLSLARFIVLMAKRLPDDVVSALTALRNSEISPRASAVYDSMFHNLEEAKRLDRPICQDTGLIQIFAKVGTSFPFIDDLEGLLTEAVRIASLTAPLRPNVVEPFAERNTGNNIGTRAPWIEYELEPRSSGLELTIYMAGGGCSLPGRAKVLTPSAGYRGMAEFVLETVATLGVNACPPLTVGVGIGTCAPSAAKLSKKAVLRPVGSRNPDPAIAKTEQMLEDALNHIGIGPQGLTGAKSVTGVQIEAAARHPAAFAVGVSVGCWVHRRGIVRFDRYMAANSPTHSEAKL